MNYRLRSVRRTIAGRLQRIGNQIDAAMIFARAYFVNVAQTAVMKFNATSGSTQAQKRFWRNPGRGGKGPILAVVS
jgi:hypothetical protein